MKKYAIGLAAVFTAIIAFAFTSKTEERKPVRVSNFFYEYVGTAVDETSIKTRTNYLRRDEDCQDGENVCGIYLPNNQPANQPPTTGDFTPTVQTALWTAQNGGAVHQDISMKE